MGFPLQCWFLGVYAMDNPIIFSDTQDKQITFAFFTCKGPEDGTGKWLYSWKVIWNMNPCSGENDKHVAQNLKPMFRLHTIWIKKEYKLVSGCSFPITPVRFEEFAMHMTNAFLEVQNNDRFLLALAAVIGEGFNLRSGSLNWSERKRVKPTVSTESKHPLGQAKL